MNIKFEKSTANGTITAPPSKSMAHRYIICSALAKGESVISNVDYSEDIKATLDCVKTLGAEVSVNEDTVTLNPGSGLFEKKELEFMCRESGSTMRFFMGIAMTLNAKSSFYGSETLRNRPFGVYEKICEEENIKFARKDDCIVIEGGIKSNEFEIRGDISSQFVTGLMYALSLKENGGRIKLIPPVESRSYINMTISSMREFGVNASWIDDVTIEIPGGSKYEAKKARVEGDYSNAAFLDAFNFIGGNVKTLGLNPDSLQGDKVYSEFFEKLSKGYSTIDLADCPDLGPVLFCVAAANKGGLFTSTERLKIKESNRGRVMCDELAKFGVETVYADETIEIKGNGLKAPTENLDGHNDHRIVMSLSLLLSITGGMISGAEAVRKSYPHFFEDIEKLGIVFERM